MLTLLSTTETTGQINVPVLDKMTNEQMAQAILSRFKPEFERWASKRTNDVNEYVRTLRNSPDEVFIDPCYEVCEDYFVLSFGFTND